MGGSYQVRLAITRSLSWAEQRLFNYALEGLHADGDLMLQVQLNCPCTLEQLNVLPEMFPQLCFVYFTVYEEGEIYKQTICIQTELRGELPEEKDRRTRLDPKVANETVYCWNDEKANKMIDQYIRQNMLYEQSVRSRREMEMNIELI